VRANDEPTFFHARTLFFRLRHGRIRTAEHSFNPSSLKSYDTNP
jgi:hypothetical protein